MGPPTHIIELRELKKAVKVGDLNLTKGDVVTTSVLLNHFKEEDYPNPYKFDPERFLDPALKSKRQNYAPFSLGSRSCIGKTLAEVVLKVIILKFTQHFEIELASNAQISPDNVELIPFYCLKRLDLKLKLRAQ